MVKQTRGQPNTRSIRIGLSSHLMGPFQIACGDFPALAKGKLASRRRHCCHPSIEVEVVLLHPVHGP